MKDDRCSRNGVATVDDVPETLTCPKCGNEIGIWTGSILTVCLFCGFRAFKKETIIN